MVRVGAVDATAPGTSTLWITPYNIRGKNFRDYFIISSNSPGGTITGEYLTGTGKCTNTTCRWPL